MCAEMRKIMRISDKETKTELEKTTLEDDAAIYNREPKKTEKEKFRSMNKAEKIQYFKDYYLKICAGVLCIALIAGIFIYDIWRSNQVSNALYIAVINYGFEDSISNQIEEEVAAYLDLPENKCISFDTSYIFTDYDFSSEEKFNVFIASSEVDLVIAPYSVFKKYAARGFMASLTDCLPTELYSTLASEFFTCRTTADDTEPVENASGSADIYGIYVDSCYPFSDYEFSEENRPILGIIANNDKLDYSIEFIRYLFNRDTILETLTLESLESGK